jgi:hypothetical protein
MGNGSSKSEQASISICEIIELAGKNKLTSIRRSMSDESDADSPKSTSTLDSNDSISSISSDQKNLSIVKRHSSLSFNLECQNFDIITDLRISDKNSIIDHIDLVLGHRRFNAVREGNDLVLCISIPKFILPDNSPLRLDIYPRTQDNPDEISYCYEGYTLDNDQKTKYMTSRIEDKSKHIVYLEGLVC